MGEKERERVLAGKSIAMKYEERKCAAFGGLRTKKMGPDEISANGRRSIQHKMLE
ncbi:MAG: hypothetical protein IJV61_07870 [Paludibacteraceae bacterium]|nr:hypothetical protein [Paludibacteraceae bacterium]